MAEEINIPVRYVDSQDSYQVKVRVLREGEKLPESESLETKTSISPEIDPIIIPSSRLIIRLDDARMSQDQPTQ